MAGCWLETCSVLDVHESRRSVARLLAIIIVYSCGWAERAPGSMPPVIDPCSRPASASDTATCAPRIICRVRPGSGLDADSGRAVRCGEARLADGRRWLVRCRRSLLAPVAADAAATVQLTAEPSSCRHCAPSLRGHFLIYNRRSLSSSTDRRRAKYRH